MSSQVYEQFEPETLTFLKKPSMYDVIMHNDDFTTMDFVTSVLVNIFHKTPSCAVSLMLRIHNDGQSVIGTYTEDIALSKKTMVDKLSKENNFPLLVTVEEKED